MKYAEPEAETIASCQARATYWKELADSLSIENQAHAARIRELEGALAKLLETCEPLTSEQSRSGEATYLIGVARERRETARRVLGEERVRE